MTPGPEWILTRINGKIAAASDDYSRLSRLLTQVPASKIDGVLTERISTEALFDLSESVVWDDLFLVGTKFQLEVWKALFDITHGTNPRARLFSYTQFAQSLGKGPGVRAVAHAIGLNPVPVVIPCHLIIPKESLERLEEIQSENGLFMWKALYVVDQGIDYGEYALGSPLKHLLIDLHMAR